MKKKIAGILAAVLLLGMSNFAWAETTQKTAEEKITINLASRILTFWRNGKKVTMYPVAVGKQETQTPTGEFSVLEMEVNPEWVDPKDTKKKVESGEDNPLGYRWMGIGGHYGIHGTNRPDSIGGYVSNGCIRLWEDNAEELYELTSIGTPVEIDYERVVIEHLPDGRVAFYIYPDGYNRQQLDAVNLGTSFQLLLQSLDEVFVDQMGIDTILSGLDFIVLNVAITDHKLNRLGETINQVQVEGVLQLLLGVVVVAPLLLKLLVRHLCELNGVTVNPDFITGILRVVFLAHLFSSSFQFFS